ncbi:MAG: phosphoribosylamine--glycine ligase [Candidatus Aminicenantes bacterium]|nr:phosphoribosylamine--glycine ligase [Candidatus Aminicenantes bacterium]
MKILIIGAGGREHALAWKISQSSEVKKIFCAPGNAGTADIAENVEIEETDIKELLEYASKEKIDLTVVGPEQPLAKGIVDLFEEKELRIFGPTKNAVEIESSKIFSKQFMERHRIPTADFKIADSLEKGKEILGSGDFSYPVVVKADGLAAGKGVIICREADEAENALKTIMVDKKFGEAGEKVVIEECLFGKEASFMVFSDGTKAVPLVTTMDHKQVFDGDKGPNTGGMGAISPSPFIDKILFAEIMQTIVYPTVTRLLEEGRKYKGVLYVGLMLTENGPKVLEYNCRFGDPETQAQMLRMDGDLVKIMQSVIEENVFEYDINWSSRPSGCVILASGGYPEKYEKGKPIQGLAKLSSLSGIEAFHAGTKKEGNNIVTNGGRVMGICASERTLDETMEKIYMAISRIKFENMHFRKDIGAVKEGKK